MNSPLTKSTGVSVFMLLEHVEPADKKYQNYFSYNLSIYISQINDFETVVVFQQVWPGWTLVTFF